MVDYARALSVLQATARRFIGIGAQRDPEGFAALITPHGPPDARAMFLLPNVPHDANSTCGVALVALIRAAARALGIHVPELEHPMNLQWWTEVVSLARSLKALRTAGIPIVGAGVHVERPGSRHWFLVESQDQDGWVSTIDGGQKDAQGYQVIRRMRRRFTISPGGVFETASQKPVVDWIDVPALLVGLASRYGVNAPTEYGAGEATCPSPRPSVAAADPPRKPEPRATDGASPTAISSPTLRRGSRGDDVARWQRIVGATADGVFGPSTERATMTWQAARGLKADGVVGPATWAKALAPAPAPFVPIEGIDVASLQGAIDWARVKAAGVRFAYLRALIGRGDIDRRLAENVRGCLEVDMPFGLYGVVYPRHDAPQDAHVQAGQLADLHRAHRAELEPAIDLEDVKPTTLTAEEYRDAFLAYRDTLVARGHDPLTYTYGPFWRAKGLDKLPAARAGRFWLAAYLATMPPAPPPFERVVCWQYQGSAPGFVGRVDGISTPVDRNKLLVPLDEIRAR